MPEAASGVSIIMPAFNEEPGLDDAVVKTLDTFDALAIPFELIVVDDASADRTGAIADELAARHVPVRAFHHEQNLGIGGAFRTGIAQARHEYIILIPVDNPLSVDDMAVYLPHMGAADIIVGVREKRAGYTLSARIGSFVYSRILLPLLFDIGVSDPNWIQLYRRRVFTESGIRIEHTGIFFFAEVLIQARRKQLSIVQVPAYMRPRIHGTPTVFRYRTMWRTFRDMLSFYRHTWRKTP